jgi:hypothetical protein
MAALRAVGVAELSVDRDAGASAHRAVDEIKRPLGDAARSGGPMARRIDRDLAKNTPSPTGMQKLVY